MSTDLNATTQSLAATAQAAGLPAPAIAAGTDFHGQPTTRFEFAGASAPLTLELSQAFKAQEGAQRAELDEYLRALAVRLGNPRPETYVTADGLPLRFTGFAWPFHRSTSGADTYIVHGTVWLADGSDSPLHAKISASMTVTFAEILSAPEQPFAEDFIYNAIRKTFDYGQLELLKSGNRQPVPVTTRYYSRWQKKFLFTDTNEEQRAIYLARKAFWLSGVLGDGAPVWLTDPRDAQYLNTTEEQLRKDAAGLAEQGVITYDPARGFGAPTSALMRHESEYRTELAALLERIKPAFNEAMRAGHTNM